MITVYALLSEKYGFIYVGMTANLERRLKEHNSGKSLYTKRFKPWKVIYKEAQPDLKAARQREKYLKSGVGKEFLKSLVP